MIGVIIVWAVGIVCIPVMKKIQPDTYKAYAVYVLAICIIITCFVGWYESWELEFLKLLKH